MSNVYDKLNAMGITLPSPPPKGGVYTPVVEFGENGKLFGAVTALVSAKSAVTTTQIKNSETAGTMISFAFNRKNMFY